MKWGSCLRQTLTVAGLSLCLLSVTNLVTPANAQHISMDRLVAEEMRAAADTTGNGEWRNDLEQLRSKLQSDTLSRDQLSAAEWQIIHYLSADFRYKQEQKQSRPDSDTLRQLKRKRTRARLKYRLASSLERLEEFGLSVRSGEMRVSSEFQQLLNAPRRRWNQWLTSRDEKVNEDRSRLLREMALLARTIKELKLLKR